MERFGIYQAAIFFAVFAAIGLMSTGVGAQEIGVSPAPAPGPDAGAGFAVSESGALICFSVVLSLIAAFLH